MPMIRLQSWSLQKLKYFQPCHDFTGYQTGISVLITLPNIKRWRIEHAQYQINLPNGELSMRSTKYSVLKEIHRDESDVIRKTPYTMSVEKGADDVQMSQFEVFLVNIMII